MPGIDALDFLFEYINKQHELNRETADTFNASFDRNRILQDSINKATEDSHDRINRKSREANQANIKDLEESDEKRTRKFQQAMANISSDITGQFRQMLVQYTNEQQKLSYSLINSGMTYSTVKNVLSVISSNAFIQQQTVYQNLTKLVSSGITMNVAQRAYLQTAADQVGLAFDTHSDSLNRLIQIYEADISESRLAQMNGLREFLEQNYKNSQYIYNGFNQVSEALLQMQSLMSADIALSTEKTIQGYLGAFTSAGGSNASGLAAAINQIGSGDFNLDQGMQNLLVMAASRAGLSYADILTNGLNANSSDALLNSMFTYIASMGDSGSNVMMNAMARLFGVNVSDIRAAQGMTRNGVSTNYSSDISDFFTRIEETTDSSVALATWWQNQISNQALTTPLGLVGFNLVNDLSQIIGGGLESMGGIAGILGTGIRNAPGVGILGSIVGQQLKNGAGIDLSNLTSLSTLKNIGGLLLKGSVSDAIIELLGTITKGVGFDNGTVKNNYLKLAGLDGSASWTTSGSGTALREAGTTTSLDITNEESAGNTWMTQEISNEAEEAHTFEDLYHLLADDYPTTTFSTVANIPHETNNVVMIGSTETTQYIVDMLTITAVSTENILMLLENAFGGANRTLIDMSALELQNMWGDWSGTSTSNP